jgi:predicted transcriptional regulator
MTGRQGRSARPEVVLAEREMDVMAVLWEHGSGTVSEVRELLQDELAYTTVLTVLRTLEKKGYVVHEEEGKAHRYLPAVERQTVRNSALRRITRKLFSGSPEALMAQLVSDRDLTPQELRKLRKMLDQRLKEEGGGQTPGGKEEEDR